MGSLDMNLTEYDLYVEMLTEAVKLRGLDAFLYQTASVGKDLYRDPSIEYIDPVSVCVMFEDNPKPILKKYGWFTEDEDLPYIVYMVSKDTNFNPVVVQEHCKLSLISTLGMQDIKDFTITNVRGSFINPLYWTCKLVPIRSKADRMPETPATKEPYLKPPTDTNISYLKTK